MAFTHLAEPIPITEQKWPEGTIPLVTTRTMTYMQENYIQDCIEGILKQKTTFPVQVLIHDDASSDRTAEIVREYEQKYPGLITAFYQPENSHSKPDKRERRRPFFELIQGSYIALCEGDDYWTDPLKLQKQVEFLEKNPDYGLVHTDYSVLDANNRRLIKSHLSVSKKGYPPTGYVFENLLERNFIGTLTVMGRKVCFDSCKFDGGDFKPQDYAIWLNIALTWKIGFLPEVTSCYRLLSNSMSHRKDMVQHIRYANNYRRIQLFFAEKGCVSELKKYELLRSFIRIRLHRSIFDDTQYPEDRELALITPLSAYEQLIVLSHQTNTSEILRFVAICKTRTLKVLKGITRDLSVFIGFRRE